MNNIKYTMGLKVRGSELHEHLTIAALEDKPEIFIKDFENLPKKAKISGEALVGPENNVSVFVVRFLKEDAHGIVLLKELFEKFNCAEKENPMTHIFFPHVSKKKGTKLNIGDEFEFESLFIKQLGPHDPYFSYKIV